MMFYITTALLLGLAGSFHCAGMCGPIALSLPLHPSSWYGKAAAGLTYNSGRTLTYIAMGALFGLLGKGIHLAGFQQLASVIIGCLMILTAAVPLLFTQRRFAGKLSDKFTELIQGRFLALMRKGSYKSLFSIGLLNGILPCGLVYVALAGAVNTGGILPAMIFMALFGLGTIPVMLAISLAGSIISLSIRKLIQRLSPYIIIILGILFILRGLSLGIPYISPKSGALVPEAKKAHECCKPK